MAGDSSEIVSAPISEAPDRISTCAGDSGFRCAPCAYGTPRSSPWTSARVRRIVSAADTMKIACAFRRATHGRTGMLKSRIAAAIVGSLHVLRRGRRRNGPGHDQDRRQSADERSERGAWRDLLARRQHRGEPHQRRQDAVEEARARDRGQPGDPAGRRGRDEQARQRRQGAVRAQRLHGGLQGDRADRRSRQGRQHQRRRGRPGPCRARRVFLERDPAGQFRGRGPHPLSSSRRRG